MPIYSSITELVGNTPMVDVSALSPNPKVRIVAKLEGWNPGGSVKDRAALSMLDEAEKTGELKPGQTILESSSGNTGIERTQLLEAWGAEIIWSPGSEGSNGAMRRAKVMAAEHPEWYFPYQYGNPANPKAHYEGTGPEIWRDCPEITHFVAGLGTAGTLMGVGHFLKERNPDIKLIAIEPPAGELVDGLKNIDEGFVPDIFEDNDGYELLDGRIIVRPRESIEWLRRFIDVGIFAGISSGAILAGAVKLINEGRIPDDSVVVVIVCDGGWKYLSTGAWTDDLDSVEARAKGIIYF
jgi:cysteine synthase